MTIFTTIEGIIPPIPVPPAVKYVYPKYKPQYPEEATVLSEDLRTFLNKQWPKGVALVTFGNERLPGAYEFEQLVNYIEANKEYGYVVALPSIDYYSEDLIKRLGELPHVLFMDWVPQ